MYKLDDFLNKRNSLRNVSDSQFEEVCEDLAHQLVCYDYNHKYDNNALLKDWGDLCKFHNSNNTINSSTRCGMKISEHFMDNFWCIKNSKGKSFANQWTYENLKKVLAWNRKSHSTPYLSEIRRGIYFCTGMTKSTMYRPSLTKTIVKRYNATVVLDPCCGWGGRMLGSVAAGANYVGFEPNTVTYANLLKIVNFLDISKSVTIYNDVAENMNKYDFPKANLILTSPPYYNLEIYSDEQTQSVKNNQSYTEWLNQFLSPVINNCIQHGTTDVISAWNVANFGKFKMIDDVETIHDGFNYYKFETFFLNSSKRPSNQNITKNAKNSDLTVCYQKG
jgi:hypothetical protein